MNKEIEQINSQIKHYSKIFQSYEYIQNTEIFFENILNEIKKNFSSFKVGFLYFDKELNEFYIKGEKISYNEYYKNYIDKSFYIEKVFTEREILIINLNQENKDFYKGIFIPYVKSIIIIPIFSSNNFYGIMVFENENNINLTDIEISTLNIISSNLNLFFHTFYFHQKIENDLLNTLKALVSSIEIKDHYTKGHSLRVMNYAIKFAFLLNLEDKIIEKIKWASLLHDIGKIGIPESILNKTLPLSENEFIIMKKHVFFSYQILQPLSFLEEERKIILHHHEKWDGTGYPYGLKGEEIPFESRIISIVDSFDAMNTNRPYRKKVNMDYIKNQFIESLGKQFDPILGEKFIQFLENKDIVAENLIS